MAERRLTITEIAKLTGYTRRQLRGFRKSGLMIPDGVGQGRGHFWYYGKVQLLSIMFSSRIEGLSRKRVGQVMCAVMNYTEPELLRAFKAGRKVLFPYGKLKLERNETAEGSEFDLEACYRATNEAIRIFAKETGAKVASI